MMLLQANATTVYWAFSATLKIVSRGLKKGERNGGSCNTVAVAKHGFVRFFSHSIGEAVFLRSLYFHSDYWFVCLLLSGGLCIATKNERTTLLQGPKLSAFSGIGFNIVLNPTGLTAVRLAPR